MPYNDWLENFDSLLSELTITWDGMLLITGEFNIDLFRKDKLQVQKYMDILTTVDFKQLITKPTRTTQHSSTLIEHIITNMPTRVTHADVLPCSLIGDHDAPYITVNVRVTRFQSRYKFIRIERGFDREAFIRDFEELPFSIIYSTKDHDLQVSYLNTLITDCLNRHAPLKCVKVTRPPASWMKELDIKQLQQVCQNLRMAAHQDNTEQTWSLFRVINKCKK